MKNLLLSIFFGLLVSAVQSQKIWSVEQANNWYKKQPWLVGANFLPSSAINQLEMWQAESFDPGTIDKELGWAEAIGMNVMRVYLHDLAWKADPSGFKSRMNQFLGIANKHHIKILYTIFDDCWNPDANIGKQPAPKPGVHNSGWVRSPSKKIHDDPAQWNYLEKYVKDVLGAFKSDKRILMWDLYNEPGNSGYELGSMPLLKKVFEWAWTVRPDQPLTSATWYNNKAFNDFVLANSDVISFHNYNNAEAMEKELIEKSSLGRPVICSEYMARTNNSRFETHLPLLKKYNVAAINWGLVSGKSNTIFPWGSKEGSSEPDPWFHDVFRTNGEPYDKKEVDLIQKLTKQ